MPTAVAPSRAPEAGALPEAPARDLVDLTERYKLPPGQKVARTLPAVQPTLGQQEQFWVADLDAGGHFSITATLVYSTSHALVYADDSLPVDRPGLARSADTFDERIFPAVRKYFGGSAVPDDVQITILNTRSPGLAGYFSSSDAFPKEVNPFSNRRDMIVLNTQAVKAGSEGYDGVLTHEFQHLVHERIRPNDETWVNEGSSELAVRLTGFQAGSGASYGNRPDTQLTAWADTLKGGDVGPHYAAAYLFMSYFAEHYGGYDALPELLGLSGNRPARFDGFLSRRGFGVSFDEVFQDWAVANYLDAPALEGGRYGYRDVDFRVRSVNKVELPAALNETVHQYGTDYWDIPLSEGASATLAFTGTTTVKLLNNDAHSGRYQWWGNRGDGIDAHMTREFDLTGLTKATLRLWTWYDIEEGFDYAYVAASTDGGARWQLLRGQFNTDSNPFGTNLGVGYTGVSGGREPRWIPQTVDLTPYAGKKVLLRFEYVTDDAYNAPGFAIDDIEIPELGYRDDAESDGGWTAQGFVRTDNAVPQDYAVQVITVQSGTTVVQKVPLDKDRRGQITVYGGRDVVLLVSGLAPVTTEVADYQVSVVSAGR